MFLVVSGWVLLVKEPEIVAVYSRVFDALFYGNVPLQNLLVAALLVHERFKLQILQASRQVIRSSKDEVLLFTKEALILICCPKTATIKFQHPTIAQSGY